MDDLYDHIWADLLKLPVDDVPREGEAREALKKLVLEGKWWQVYDFFEFVIHSPHNRNRKRLQSEVDRVLKEELAGFRLVGGRFVEITSETEIEAVENAFDASATDRYRPVRAHLEAALDLLGDRKATDYRNSIKESISAVEAVARIVSGDGRAELGNALKALEGEEVIHGALRAAMSSLYGYTSDADGIRHALTKETTADGPLAKYVLVICAAFVNYVIQRADGSREDE